MSNLGFSPNICLFDVQFVDSCDITVSCQECERKRTEKLVTISYEMLQLVAELRNVRRIVTIKCD